jgi:hypothetical protein
VELKPCGLACLPSFFGPQADGPAAAATGLLAYLTQLMKTWLIKRFGLS